MRASEIQTGAHVAINLGDFYYSDTVRRGTIINRISKSPALYTVRFSRPLTQTNLWHAPTPGRSGDLREYEIQLGCFLSPWEEYRTEIQRKKGKELAEQLEREEREHSGPEAIAEFKKVLQKLGYKEDCAHGIMNNDWDGETWMPFCELTLTPTLLNIINQALSGQIKNTGVALSQLLSPTNDQAKV